MPERSDHGNFDSWVDVKSKRGAVVTAGVPNSRISAPAEKQRPAPSHHGSDRSVARDPAQCIHQLLPDRQTECVHGGIAQRDMSHAVADIELDQVLTMALSAHST